jgi:hypothetical protein
MVGEYGGRAMMAPCTGFMRIPATAVQLWCGDVLDVAIGKHSPAGMK